MAKKTYKEKNVDLLKFKIKREKELAKNWKKFDISQKKIDKIEAKEAKHTEELSVWEAL